MPQLDKHHFERDKLSDVHDLCDETKIHATDVLEVLVFQVHGKDYEKYR